MGINVQLQDEDGQLIEEVEEMLPTTLGLAGQAYDVQNFPLTSGIDGYGDTIFNRMQMPHFLAEWKVLTLRVKKNNPVMAQVGRLAERCRAEVHLYLAFIGD